MAANQRFFDKIKIARCSQVNLQHILEQRKKLKIGHSKF